MKSAFGSSGKAAEADLDPRWRSSQKQRFNPNVENTVVKENKPAPHYMTHRQVELYSAHTVTDKDCLLERFSLISLYLKNIFSFYPR